MNEHDEDREYFDRALEAPPPETLEERSIFEHIIPRLLRNILVVSIVFAAPVFRVYSWAGAIGFACGSAVSYVNFRALTRGIEGLADRVVNRNSREKGGRIILRFLVRYGLVGAAAYAIFKGSSLAFYGFLWGLCVPAAALMVEAAWEGYLAFRRQS